MQHGWTLNKQKWDYLLPVVSGTHWSKTQLNQLNRDSIPETSGVYAICVKLDIRDFNQCLFRVLYEIIYVGKSAVSLHNRFLKHCRRPERGIKQAKECFGDNFEYWYTEVNPDRVAELEARLIECFGPPANRIRGSIPGQIGQPRPA